MTPMRLLTATIAPLLILAACGEETVNGDEGKDSAAGADTLSGTDATIDAAAAEDSGSDASKAVPDAAHSDAGSDVAVDPGTDRFMLAWGGKWDDEAKGVARAASGELLVAGYTQSTGQGDWDGLLLRLDACGKVVGAHAYGGEKKDEFFAVQATSDGGVILAGASESFGGFNEAWLVKTDSKGELQWSKRYGGAGADAAHGVVNTHDGHLVLAETYNFGPGTPNAHNMMLFRVDSAGKVMWERAFGGGVDGDAGFAVLPIAATGATRENPETSGFWVGGSSESFSVGKDDLWLMRLGPDGAHHWSKRYGDTQDDELRGLSDSGDGGLLMTGFTRSFDASNGDVFALKTNLDGDVLWMRRFGGKDHERGYGIFPVDGGALLMGHTASFGHAYEDGFIAMIGGDGKAKWWRNLGGGQGEKLVAAVPVTEGLVMVGRTTSFKGAELKGGKDKDVLVLRADTTGETSCAWLDLPLKDLSTQSCKPQVATFTPEFATGMTSEAAKPVTAAVTKAPTWVQVRCDGGQCATSK